MPWLLLYWASHPSQGSESSLLQTQNIKGGLFVENLQIVIKQTKIQSAFYYHHAPAF